jgi:hypothetical protein
MKFLKISIAFITLTLVLGLGGSTRVIAQTGVTSSIAEIQKLLAEIAVLQGQLAEIQNQQAQLKQEIIQSLRLARQLGKGMSGEDVKLLQEILATDPSIYPEGLVTGFFGSLTEDAVRKFQAKNGLEQAGRVGPQTLERINKLLADGAGKSGRVPPGFLISPGIARKIGQTPTIPEGQVLPRGISQKIEFGQNKVADNTPPVIGNLGAISNSSGATVTISWITNKPSVSKIWFSTISPVAIDVNPSTSSPAYTTNHLTNFAGLNAGTTYYYIVSSTDKAGNTSMSAEQSVTTSSQ